MRVVHPLDPLEKGGMFSTFPLEEFPDIQADQMELPTPSNLVEVAATEDPLHMTASGLTHLAALVKTSMLAGSKSPRFHTCVLPRWTRTQAFDHNSSATTMCASMTLSSSGEVMQMSSGKTITFSLFLNLAWVWTKSMGMRGSPPPLPLVGCVAQRPSRLPTNMWTGCRRKSARKVDLISILHPQDAFQHRVS